MEKPWLKHYEPGVRAHIEYPARPMHAFLEDVAAQSPNTTATIFGGVVQDALLDATLTYKELNDQANQMANALAAMGVKKGDRVALYLPNCPQYVISYYAILKLGAIIAPNNPMYVPRELEFQLNDSGAETIICLSRLYPYVRMVRPNTKLKNVIVTSIKEYFPPRLKAVFEQFVEEKEGHRATLGADEHWFQDVLNSAPAIAPNVAVNPEDTAVLLYTGGTTGVPKAAEITQKNVVANAFQCKEWVSNVPREVGSRGAAEATIVALPLYHSYAMTVCMNNSVLQESTMILIPDPRNLVHLLKSIDCHHPTYFPGVPTMYTAILNHPDLSKYSIKSIKACLSGAAALPLQVQTKFQELTGARLVEGYGLSEATPVTHDNPLFGDNRIGTIGVPFPDTDSKIVDVETGEQEMPVGERGELIVKGPQVMKGYWNKPEETRLALRNGWLYTGDIAVMDEDGYFRIVDRKKEMIIAGGYNIYPRDVEEVLYQHPKILEAAVAGVSDAYRGETVKAYVVLKPGETATAEDIMAFCRERLAAFKSPKIVEFRESLPKTMIGKILRRQLVAEDQAKAQAATEK
ncbi:MAG: long-chain fatty acid--CoA ligase [Chloroflexi bacterium RBG_16_56_8]|nr:MAG: long-chain fatty acid--CoA ligase [Chloroflexi bacterium RBG_16_56_8]